MIYPSKAPVVQQRLPAPVEIFYDDQRNDPLTYRFKRSTAEAFPQCCEGAATLSISKGPRLNAWDYACRALALMFAAATTAMTFI